MCTSVGLYQQGINNPWDISMETIAERKFVIQALNQASSNLKSISSIPLKQAIRANKAMIVIESEENNMSLRK